MLGISSFQMRDLFNVRIVALVFLSTLYSLQLTAQLGGQSVFNTLDIPASARIAAMGGALPAVTDGDLNLALYNPSLLDSTMDQQVALSYVNYFSGVNLGFASYAHHLDSIGVTVSATMQYVDYGAFTERDAAGVETGEFRAGDYALVLGAGYRVDSLFTIGANLKTIYSNLSVYDAWGVALDGGVTYHNPKRQLTASLVLRNLGRQVDGYTDNVQDTLPVNLQFGFSKRLRHAPFRFSVVFDQMQQWDLRPPEENQVVTDPITGEIIEDSSFEFGDLLMRHVILGAEVLLGENFNLQVGYNYRRRQELKLADRPGTAGFSWGIGARIKRFSINYGRAIYHQAGPSNHFTVRTRLSDW